MNAPEQLSLTNPREREAALKATVEEAVIRLARQLSEGHTEEFQQFLKFYSRFWTYSARNGLLIQLQCPGAIRCAGRTLWNNRLPHQEGGESHLDLGADYPSCDGPGDRGSLHPAGRLSPRAGV